jgi:Domain of unknown function (DUF6532)
MNVIRDLYFAGGNNSFALRFRELFPVHQGNDGMVLREVPVPMVALVATAVSATYDLLLIGIWLKLMSNQLYAAIQEWRTGTHRTQDFSANSFLDVYSGHVNTFNHIRERREDAFHTMMSDIYMQAR